MIKLIACDLDGTLVPASQKLSEKTVTLLKSLSDHNIRFVIATGRSYGNTKALLDTYSFNFDLILNGGHETRYLDNTTSLHGFNNQKLRDIVAILSKYDHTLTYYSNNHRYATLTKDNQYNNLLRYFSTILNRTLTKEDLAIPMLNKEVYLTDYIQINSVEDLINQAIPILKLDIQILNNMEQCLNEIKTITGIDVSNSYDFFIEIVQSNSNKALAVLELAHKYQIKEEEIAIFGDSLNDLSMFNTFSNNYAPKSAHKAILEKTNHFIAEPEEDGVYHQLIKIIHNTN